jgi:hypothetical protein
VSERQCGGCTLCCTLLGVTELSKPAGQQCVFEDRGGGCRIYGERPQVCRSFQCLWLRDPALLPSDDQRPDRSHVVLWLPKDAEPFAKDGLAVEPNSGETPQSALEKQIGALIDPEYPDALKSLDGAVDTLVANGWFLTVIAGKKRSLVASEQTLHAILPKPGIGNPGDPDKPES